MKFKVDENLPVEVAELLRDFGYDATTVLEQQLGGASDKNVAAICREEDRVIVTIDLDFSDIRTYPPQDFAGLIVLRLTRQDKFHVMAVFMRLIPLLTREKLDRKLWIVEDNRIRIRA
jgi:predicted nuclease of predicted toxin-antitoxin system